MQYEDTYTEKDGACDPGDTSCDWLGKSNDKAKNKKQDKNKGSTDKPLPKPGSQNNCTDSACTNVTESEINTMIEAATVLQGIEITGGVAFGALGGLLIFTPAAAYGVGALFLTAELGMEGVSTSDMKSYLMAAQVAAHNNNGMIQISKDEHILGTTYEFEGASTPHTVRAPITRAIVDIWFWTSSWEQ
jgi:hypothetical protein